MKPLKIIFSISTVFFLLVGCTPAAEVTPTPTPALEATHTPTPTPTLTPEPTPIPTEPVTDPESILATVEGFYHRPFEELPQELRGSLEWDGEILSLWLDARMRRYTGPGIIIMTTEAPEEYLQEWLEEQLSLPKGDEARRGTDEELRAEYEREKGREWLYSVTITDDSYATLAGLKVGNTLEEAAALGYDLSQYLDDDGNGLSSFGILPGENLCVYVKNGVVEKMELMWGLGRYVGKYFEL